MADTPSSVRQLRAHGGDGRGVTMMAVQEKDFQSLVDRVEKKSYPFFCPIENCLKR
jgi:hypothetical protein